MAKMIYVKLGASRRFLMGGMLFLGIITLAMVAWMWVANKPFRSAGDGGLFFNPHASVLFLSPCRNDDSFFFAGRICRLQQLLVVVLFIYMMWLFAAKVQTDNATGVAPAFGVMLSLAAFVMQPFLLQHMIKLRLVLLKRKGLI